jgi:biopolymer transport protein ExbB/TolQ
VVIVEALMQVAETYGLFVALVVYVLWNNNSREQKYIEVIEKLSDAFESLKQDLTEIKIKIDIERDKK